MKINFTFIFAAIAFTALTSSHSTLADGKSPGKRRTVDVSLSDDEGELIEGINRSNLLDSGFTSVESRGGATGKASKYGPDKKRSIRRAMKSELRESRDLQ